MSFRKYGGTNKLEKNNNITVHSIVADTFTIRDAFLSIFTIEGDLKIGGNGIISNNLLVNQQIDASTLDISLNAIIEGNLYLDKQQDVFLKGNNQMIGINTITPTATLDISSAKVQAFNIKTSNVNNRNIIARNLSNNGIAVTATGTTESGIQFYSANTGTIDVSNAQGAIIKYSNTDNVLSLDSMKDVKIISKMIITDNTNTGNTHTTYDETMLVYDKDNGVNQPIFFNEIYGNTTVKTGSAVTLQSINNASNTFMNIVAPNKLGLQLGGGPYPKDPTRSMGIVDVFNPIIDIHNTSLDTDATPAMMIISGNSVTKYNTTTGFNTFQPKYNDYAVDINGPLHLNNGEVKKTLEPTERIYKLYNYGSNFGIAVGGQGSEEDKYYSYITLDGGKSWTKKNPYNTSDTQYTISSGQIFSSAYSYDATRTIVGGSGALSYVTDNGGANWLQLLITGINTIDAIYVPPDISNNFVYTGGISSDGINAIIRYGYIEKYEFDYGPPSNAIVNRYKYADISYNYPITGGIVSDFAGYGQNLLVVGGNKIRKFDLGITKMGPLTLSSTYTNPGSVTYSAVRLVDTNNGVAVGSNVISYTKNGGSTWTTANIIPLAGKTFNDVFLDSSMNAIAVGNNGCIYSSNDGYYTWKVVNEDVLNASGIGARIVDTTNDITSVFMPDSSTIILSIVKNNDSNAKTAKLYYLNMPNIFNNKNNFLFDVSGCIRMSGDLHINEGGEIKSKNSTFNFVTTDVAILNAGTNALYLNMGGTNTTNINLGGANSSTINIGGINSGNVIIGGNVTNTRVGPLNVSNLTNGNVILSNNLVTGNIYPSNVAITNVLTTDYIIVKNTLDSISATSGALQIYGGLGIQKSLYSSGDINTSGNVLISGDNFQMTSTDDISLNNITTTSFDYVPDSGPMRITGGVAINKDAYIGKDIWINGNLVLKGQLKTLGGATVTTSIDSVLIVTPFHGNSTQDVDYLSLAQGALTTEGGFAVGKNTWLRGNLRVDGVDGTVINSTQQSVNATTGALRVTGGVGIGMDTIVRGNVVVNSTIEAINTSTGALRISGGVGVGGNIQTSGNVITYSIIESTSTNTGALQIRGGVGIGRNLYTGGNIIINSTIEAISTATGSFRVTGGVGIGGNIYTGGNVIVNSVIETTSTNTGALQVRGGVSIGRNLYTGGNVIVNSTIESTSTTSGALQVVGGVGIGGNLHACGGIIACSVIESTGINTGAVQIHGGVSIRRNLYTGGNVIVNSTIETTSTSTGALQITGGIGVGGNVYTGGNVIVNSLIESTSTNTGALQIKGGVSIGRNLYTGGNIIINSTIETTSIQTGALQIIGGVGIGGNVYTGGNVIINSTIESTSTNTGALHIMGGTSIRRNLFVGGNTIVNSTIESTSINTGALQIIGGIGVGGNVNIGGNTNIGKVVIITDTTESLNVTTGALQVRGGVGITNRLTVGSVVTGQISATNLSLTSSSASENVNTGALIITGGVGVGGSINTGGNIIVNSVIESTSTNTGALQVKGGIGVAGNVYSNVVYTNAIYTTDVTASGQMTFNSANESSSSNTGAVVISGGLGVAKNTNIGGNLIVSRATTLSGGLAVVGSVNTSGIIIINSTIESTSTNTGALQVRGGIGVAGNVYSNVVYTNAIYTTDVTASGQMTFNSANESSSSNTGAVVISGGLGVAKNTNIGGNLIVSRATTLSGGLAVTGGTLLVADTTVSGLLRVIRGTTLSGGLTVTGGTLSASDTTVSGLLRVIGGTTLSGGLAVNGGTTISGGLEVNGGTLLASDTTVSGILRVTGGTTLSGGLAVNGGTTISGGLAVTGGTILASDTTVSGSLYIGGALLWPGFINSNLVYQNSTVNGILRVFGGTTLSGGLAVTGGALLAPDTTISGALRVIGGTTLTGGLAVTGGALLTPDTTVSGLLRVIGGTTLSGGLAVTGGALLTPDTTVSGLLRVNGGTTLSGGLAVGGGTVLTDTTITGTLNLTGQINLNGIPKVYQIPSINTGNVTAWKLGVFTSSSAGCRLHIQLYIHNGVTGATGGAEDCVYNINAKFGSTTPFFEAWHTREGPNTLNILPVWSPGDTGLTSAISTNTLYITIPNSNAVIQNSFYVVTTSTASGCSWQDTQAPGGPGLSQITSFEASNITYATSESTSTNTGALQVLGGVGITKNLNVGGSSTFTTTSITGTLNVGGASTISGVLRVAGITTISGALNITAGSTISGGFNVSSGVSLINTAITSTSTGSGSLRIVGGLGVSGNIHAGSMVTAPIFNATSDRRIKKDITNMNCNSLEIMRQLRPREYVMIDGGKETVYGFIAQEVKEIIPKSIYLRKGFIPSVYENAFVNGNEITLINKTTTDISCCSLKIRDKNNIDIIVSVIKIQDEKTFLIRESISQSTSCIDICGNILDIYVNNGITTYMSGSQIYTGDVKQGIFVYGIQVDDFHTINKDTIWTVTLSATQEMDSQLQEARRTIRTLEERISAIEKRLS